MANVNRTKNSKSYKASDFMPKFAQKKQSAEQMGAMFSAFAAVHNAQKRKGN